MLRSAIASIVVVLVSFGHQSAGEAHASTLADFDACRKYSQDDTRRIFACTTIINDLTQAVEVRAEAFAQRGQLYERRRDERKAEADYRQANMLDSSLWQSIMDAAEREEDRLHEKGNGELHQPVITLVSIAIRLNPQASSAHCYRARLRSVRRAHLSQISQAISDASRCAELLQAQLANDGATPAQAVAERDAYKDTRFKGMDQPNTVPLPIFSTSDRWLNAKLLLNPLLLRANQPMDVTFLDQLILAEQTSDWQWHLNEARSLRAISLLMTRQYAAAVKLADLQPVDVFYQVEAAACANYVAGVAAAAESNHVAARRAAKVGFHLGAASPLLDFCVFNSSVAAGEALLKTITGEASGEDASTVRSVVTLLVQAREYPPTSKTADLLISSLSRRFESARFVLRLHALAARSLTTGSPALPEMSIAATPSRPQGQTPHPERSFGAATATFQHGVVRTARGEHVAPFRVKTKQGLDYAFKITRADDGGEVMFGFITGGRLLETTLPTGTFELRYCAGSDWIDERELFGKATACAKAVSHLIFTREQDRLLGVEVELILQKSGNLKTQRIDSANF